MVINGNTGFDSGTNWRTSIKQFYRLVRLKQTKRKMLIYTPPGYSYRLIQLKKA